MKIAIKALLLAVLILAPLSISADETNQSSGSNYVIGPGDVIEISVWNNENLSRLVTVLPDGMISFPLIGETLAEGKTAGQLRKELADKISRYEPDPVLTVIVQNVNSMMIYVIGKVNRPGHFVLNTDINVLQALTMAGGLNVFAKKKKIKIFREKGDKTVIIDFNYEKVVNGDNLEQNIVLMRGDVIVIP